MSFGIKYGFGAPRLPMAMRRAFDVYRDMIEMEDTDPAEAELWSSTAVSGSPPPMGIGASENLLAHIENLANTAEMPATAAIEKNILQRKR